MDPKLSPIVPHLQEFGEQFRFRSYKLLSEQTFDLDWKTPAQMELPGSRSLQVTPRALDKDDQKLLALMTKRVGVALRLQRLNAVVRSSSGLGQYMVWEIAR